MKRILSPVRLVALAAAFAGCAWCQSDQPKTSPGAGHDIGSGAGDIGKGTAKGAGKVALGTAKGVGDLVTLHPVSAAGAVGKGALGGGKDVTVGAVKGTGKMARGVGKLIRKAL